MKVCFFHLMPYRVLPDDFERKYRTSRAAVVVLGNAITEFLA